MTSSDNGEYEWADYIRSQQSELYAPSWSEPVYAERSKGRKAFVIGFVALLAAGGIAFVSRLFLLPHNPAIGEAEPLAIDKRSKEMMKYFKSLSGRGVYKTGNGSYSAASWMLMKDDFRLPVDSPQLTQRYVLALIYFSLSHGNSVWLDEETHECNWQVVRCNTEKEVVALELDASHLIGSLPTEIGLLTSLESLNLRDNLITGTVPKSWEHLTSLENLFLDGNDLEGSIPDFFCTSLAMNELTADCEGELHPVDCSCCTNCMVDSVSFEVDKENRDDSHQENDNDHISDEILEGVKNEENPKKKSEEVKSTPENGVIETVPELEIEVEDEFEIEAEMEKELEAEEFEQEIETEENAGMYTEFEKNNDLETEEESEVYPVYSSPTEMLYLISTFSPRVGDPDSPQEEAYEWLISEGNSPINAESPALKQRYVLALLYLELGGQDWPFREWLSKDKSECNFPGVGCNDNFEVISVALVSSNLKGTIPSELSELSKLEVLDLSDNDIRGTIPNNLSAMEYMRTLHLQHNDLSGYVSPDLCHSADDIKVDCELVSCSCCSC